MKTLIKNLPQRSHSTDNINQRKGNNKSQRALTKTALLDNEKDKKSRQWKQKDRQAPVEIQGIQLPVAGKGIQETTIREENPHYELRPKISKATFYHNLRVCHIMDAPAPTP